MSLMSLFSLISSITTLNLLLANLIKLIKLNKLIKLIKLILPHRSEVKNATFSLHSLCAFKKVDEKNNLSTHYPMSSLPRQLINKEYSNDSQFSKT